MLRQLVVAIALCAPFVLRAQTPVRTVEPNGMARTFLSFGPPYGGWLLLAFDSIPQSRYGFRPTPLQQSIGYIAQHLESANYALCSRFGAQQHMMTAKDSLADTVKAQWPKDTLIDRVRASLAFCQAAILQMTDAQLADTLIAPTPSGPQPVLRVRYLMLLIPARHARSPGTRRRLARAVRAVLSEGKGIRS